MVSQGSPNILRVFTINVKEEGREGGKEGRKNIKSAIEETKAMHKENFKRKTLIPKRTVLYS